MELKNIKNWPKGQDSVIDWNNKGLGWTKNKNGPNQSVAQHYHYQCLNQLLAPHYKCSFLYKADHYLKFAF